MQKIETRERSAYEAPEVTSYSEQELSESIEAHGLSGSASP